MDNIWDKISHVTTVTGGDDIVIKAFDTALNNLSKTVRKHRFTTKEKADIFVGAVHGDAEDSKDQGHYLADMFVRWRCDGNAITLPELLLLACDYFDISHDHKLFPPALTACVLGEIPHDNPYHNNFHFREVFTVLMRFCAHHNLSDMPDNLKFSHDEVLFILLCAAVHDFAHDGSTNMVDGEIIPSKIEKNSVKLVQPFLSVAGLPKDIMVLLELMIVATDTLRNSQGRSPAGISRDIYLAHVHNNLAILDVPAFYEPLVQNYKWALMTRMMCEADITPSSGVSYPFSKDMTIDISKENEHVMAAATTLYVFMEVICHGGYDTPTAKALLGHKFKEILQAVRNDSVNGVLYA